MSAIAEKPPIGVNDGWADHTSILARLASPKPMSPIGGVPIGPRLNSALPPGYVALKGDVIVCEQCGDDRAYLNMDLPEPSQRKGLQRYADQSPYYAKACTCGADAFYKDTSATTRWFYVRNRGWV